jgi:hypothetical protein
MNTDFSAKISAKFDFGRDLDYAAKFDFGPDLDFAAEFDFSRDFLPTQGNESSDFLFGSGLEYDKHYDDESMSHQERHQHRHHQKRWENWY